MSKLIYFLAFAFCSILVLSSCETDDDPIPEQFETTYAIEEVENSGVFGNITFKKSGEDATIIIIELEGTVAGVNHPANLFNTSPEKEQPAFLALNPVDGASGRSETVVTILDDGSRTTYEDWVGFDGYVTIQESMENPDANIAIGFLGENIPNIPGG